MTWCRVGSRAATAARTATVLPAPTSPVTTPRAASTTRKLIRAIASARAWRANRSRAGCSCRTGSGSGRSGWPATPGSPVFPVAARGELAEPGEVDLRAGAGFLVVSGGDQAEVVDPGRGRRGPGSLGDRAVHVPA